MGGEAPGDRPEWWDWELGFTAHLEERMLMRGLAEVELRSMLETASALDAAGHPGRWLVRTRHAGRSWVVVVEPDEMMRKVMVVTAYPIEA
jgi:hypothetical protein